MYSLIYFYRLQFTFMTVSSKSLNMILNLHYISIDLNLFLLTHQILFIYLIFSQKTLLFFRLTLFFFKQSYLLYRTYINISFTFS